MNAKQENQFKSLVEFLGKVLGPDYEITLHNLTKKRSSLVAIANGHISGREVGAPSTGFVENMLAKRPYETNDYVLSYHGRAINNKTLRSSSFFIRNDAQKPVGMLCINFDDSRYRELSKKLLTLCHPVSFLEQNMVYTAALPAPESQSYATFYSDMETAIGETFSAVMQETEADLGLLSREESDANLAQPDSAATDTEPVQQTREAIDANLERLAREEKVKIVIKLYEKGFFHMKGSIPYAAEKFHCSVASIYRYLKDAKALTGDGDE